jgi:ankyrin repeat protein
LHKFASWNKTEYIDLILPHLSKAQVNAQDREGKTAVHWACEMASVAVRTPRGSRSGGGANVRM